MSESAGRPKGNAGTGKGDRYLARVVGEAAVSAARSNPERSVRQHVRELRALGYAVTLNPAA